MDVVGQINDLADKRYERAVYNAVSAAMASRSYDQGGALYLGDYNGWSMTFQTSFIVEDGDAVIASGDLRKETLYRPASALRLQGVCTAENPTGIASYKPLSLAAPDVISGVRAFDNPPDIPLELRADPPYRNASLRDEPKNYDRKSTTSELDSAKVNFLP